MCASHARSQAHPTHTRKAACQSLPSMCAGGAAGRPVACCQQRRGLSGRERVERGGGRAGEPGTYLPVAEHQLRTGQAARPLPDFISKAEAFGHGQHGLDDEHVRPLLHLFLKHSAFSLRQDGVDPACKAIHLLNSLPGHVTSATHKT